MVDAGIAQAYVDVITSVPHGTSSVRRYGQRSAQTASAPRARHRAQILTHRSLKVRQPRAFVGTFMNCEPRDLSRRIVPRIMRRGENAFTSGVALPWND